MNVSQLKLRSDKFDDDDVDVVDDDYDDDDDDDDDDDNNNNNNNIAAPNIYNLANTITNKQNKYQELTNEICAMWKQNTAQVIPLVISYTGVIPKSLPQSLKRLNLHPSTYIQMQKICNSWNAFNCKKLFKL